MITFLDRRIQSFLVQSGIMKLLEISGFKKPLSKLWYIAREIEVLIDYWSFRRRHGNYLCKGIDNTGPQKKVLIVCLATWVWQVKIEAILAKALQLNGYTPVIATYKSAVRAHRYFRVFGLHQFVFFDDPAQTDCKLPLTSEVKELLDQVTTFDSLIKLQHRDVDMGRHVLSRVLRKLHVGRVDLSDHEFYRNLKQYITKSEQTIRAAEEMVKDVQPSMVLFFEKGYTPLGEIFDVVVNRGLNVIQWSYTHRNDAFTLKRYTREMRYCHPFSLSDKTWDFVRQMPWTDEHESVLMGEMKGRYKKGTWFNRYGMKQKTRKTREEIERQLDLDTSKKTAVVFSHVLWDATFFYGNNIFETYEDWLIETVRTAILNPSVNWLVKLHPHYVWKIKKEGINEKIRDNSVISEEFGVLPNHVKLLNPDTDISTFALFDVTDYCLTVRGTIGMEMSCFGIPVLTAGTGRYSNRGFTIDSESYEDYIDKLRHIQDLPSLNAEQTVLARKHAYALFNLRPWKFETFQTVTRPFNKLGHPLDDNIVIHAKSIQDIVEAADLNDFVEWATGSTQVDYLRPHFK